MPLPFFKSVRAWFTEWFRHLLSEGQLWQGQQKGSPLPTQKPAFQLVPSSANLMQPRGVIVPGLPSPGHRLYAFCTPVNAVSPDDWACPKHLCFSLDICYRQWRLSLYREEYSRPHSRWLLLRLNAPRGAVLPKTTISRGNSASGQVRAWRSLLLLTPVPRRCGESRYALLRGGRTGPAPSKVGSRDADVVLPWVLGDCTALLLQTVWIFVRVISDY